MDLRRRADLIWTTSFGQGIEMEEDSLLLYLVYVALVVRVDIANLTISPHSRGSRRLRTRAESVLMYMYS
jgi:hypothetical protein